MLKRTQLTIKKWCLTPKEERMKYFIIIGVLFMCSFSQADRFYETEYGNINLSSLESILSSDMGGVPVTDLRLQILSSPGLAIGLFEMNFVIDNYHNMSCNLVISEYISIPSCISETALYNHEGVIDLRAVISWPKSKKQY